MGGDFTLWSVVLNMILETAIFMNKSPALACSLHIDINHDEKLISKKIYKSNINLACQ